MFTILLLNIITFLQWKYFEKIIFLSLLSTQISNTKQQENTGDYRLEHIVSLVVYTLTHSNPKPRFFLLASVHCFSSSVSLSLSRRFGLESNGNLTFTANNNNISQTAITTPLIWRVKSLCWGTQNTIKNH